jgi:hypothetical protein
MSEIIDIETEVVARPTTRNQEDFPTAVEWHQYCADEILVRYKEATRLAGETSEIGSQAVAEALRCGQMLVAKREEIGKGKKWGTWLGIYLPEMHIRKVQRWMQMVERATLVSPDDPALLLKDSKDCKAAYVALGILPEKDGTPSNGKGSTTFLDLLIAFRQSKQFDATKVALSEWPEHDLKAVVDAFDPVIELRDQIAEALSAKLRA